jgi:hypothetical protein
MVLGNGTEVRMGNTYRVGEERGSKEMDGCPLTDTTPHEQKTRLKSGNT